MLDPQLYVAYAPGVIEPRRLVEYDSVEKTPGQQWEASDAHAAGHQFDRGGRAQVPTGSDIADRNRRAVAVDLERCARSAPTVFLLSTPKLFAGGRAMATEGRCLLVSRLRPRCLTAVPIRSVWLWSGPWRSRSLPGSTPLSNSTRTRCNHICRPTRRGSLAHRASRENRTCPGWLHGLNGWVFAPPERKRRQQVGSRTAGGEGPEALVKRSGGSRLEQGVIGLGQFARDYLRRTSSCAARTTSPR